MMRALVPVGLAAVFAAGAVWYGMERRLPPLESRSSPVAVSKASGGGEAERSRAAKQRRDERPLVAEEEGTVLPIQGLRAADIQDTFNQSRGGGERVHEATDILAPRGTPVHAMVDGVIRKLFLSKPGGITIYEFDSEGNYCYYYAHLDRYAEGIKEGQAVRAGDVIGYVGTTGNADPNTPHLHLAILQLGPEKKWWEGTTPINPYPLLMGLVGEQTSR